MALIDKASLLMVPSTYEDGTLYNVLPSGNKAPDETGNHNGYDQTRADFTFSRGFNLTATRVNADGLIEKGRENILLRSNDFDTTWTDFSGASGQSGYDGNSSAWRYDSSSSALRLQQVGISISGVKTYSIYAKYVDAQWFSLQIAGASTEGAWFDIQNGTLGTTTNAIDSKIEAIGTDGWYRCSVTGSVDSQNRVRLYVVGSDGSSTTITGSIYIQDAQLEVGLVATDYIETGATTATAGVLENTPRIDYSSGAGALLLEPQRTNLATLSEYFEGWSHKQNVTATSNYITSPEGIKNATRLQFTANGYLYNQNAPAQAGSTQYTLSCYAKRNDSGTQSFGFFKDGSGAVDSEMSLTSEWKRFDYTYTASAVTQLGLAGLSGADVSIYGFQVEAASYPSSYVPTYGSAATRGADSCSVTGASDILNDSEGTFFVEFEGLGSDTAPYLALSAGGSTANRVLIYESSGINAQIKVGGTIVFQSTTASVSGNVKAAVAYKANDFVLYVNGSQYGTSSSGSTFGAGVLTEVEFDHASAALIGAQIKKSIVFSERLSNTELATLTTL